MLATLGFLVKYYTSRAICVLAIYNVKQRLGKWYFSSEGVGLFLNWCIVMVLCMYRSRLVLLLISQEMNS